MGIGRAEALDSFRSDDLIGIGMEADAVRRRLHPEGVVSYAVGATVRCGEEDAAVCERAAAMVELGASGISLAGAGALAFERLAGLVESLRSRLPEASLAALEPEEVPALAASAGMDVTALLRRLCGAGLDSLLPVGAAGGDTGAWLAVHRAAHKAKMRTIAVLSYAAGQSAEERVAMLTRIAELQAETGCFLALAAEPVATGLQGPTAVDSLRTLAIARLMVDTIDHVQMTRAQGLKVLEAGLRFGADDAGEISISQTGAPDLREEELRRVLRDAGFRPAQRRAGYGALFTV